MRRWAGLELHAWKAVYHDKSAAVLRLAGASDACQHALRLPHLSAASMSATAFAALADQMPSPGAKMSTQGPRLENGETAAVTPTDPTVMVSGWAAPIQRHASPPGVDVAGSEKSVLPAARTTGAPVVEVT